MALDTRFNAKNGLSVGIPAVPILDNVGNATVKSLSAESIYLSGACGYEKVTTVNFAIAMAVALG
jgi:hypothetical protein